MIYFKMTGQKVLSSTAIVDKLQHKIGTHALQCVICRGGRCGTELQLCSSMYMNFEVAKCLSRKRFEKVGLSKVALGTFRF